MWEERTLKGGRGCVGDIQRERERARKKEQKKKEQGMTFKRKGLPNTKKKEGIVVCVG